MSASCVSVGQAGSKARPQASTHLGPDSQEVDGEVIVGTKQLWVGLVWLGNQLETQNQLPLSVSSPFWLFPFLCVCLYA